MKKYSVLLAIVALVLASLACQTIMGGGNDDFTPPNVDSDSSDATQLPESNDDSGDVTVGDSPFPTPSDAFNVYASSETVTFETNLSTDEISDFYRDELGKQGYSEDTSLTTNFNGIVAMFFTGNGKTVVMGVVPSDNDANLVTLAYQEN
jgi:hypothetical protein